MKARVLVIDTLSGTNDFGVSLAMALSTKVTLTFLTVENSLIPPNICARLLKVMPGYGMPKSKVSKGLDLLKYLLTLARELWRHRDAAVHIQFFRFTGVEALLYILARPFLRRLVHTAHNALPHEPKWWHRRFYRFWYSMVDAIHVLSENTKAELLELGAPPDKISLVHHGDYRQFKDRYAVREAAAIRKDLGAVEADRVVLFFGLIREYKGLKQLVDAFCQMPADSPAFLVVEGGGDRDLFEAGVHAIEHANRTHRCSMRYGFVPDPRLAELLTVADLVVFPYRKISQSGALLLAMTYGKPILAADIAGFREYLGKEGGWMVDVSDTAGFSGALNKIVTDPHALAEQAIRCTTHCEARFEWDKIATQLTRLYV